ncbi:MAG: ribosome small subunit-dependent GTPase A [Opitutus sp.]|nr:ribosome small subunit-dependent GTPase A [Opitutus sp.]
MHLSSLGWDDFFSGHFAPFASDLAGFMPARVALEHKHAYALLAAHGEVTATCTGKLRHDATARADLPAVGDWVVVRPRPGEAHADIHAVLPRKTKFSRQAAGDGTEQIVAANIDTVFLVTALDADFNLRRIERYLAVAWASGAQPVVLLNKSDLHADPAAARATVEAVAGGAPVLVLSATHDTDLSAALAPWLAPGRTVALLGSSGVGKSTLINRLLGAERQLTSPTSAAHGKGRHTTTHRELLVAPSGALVIDTPGMRELQLWEVAAATLEETFADIAALAARCRFSNCAHRAEPGCTIQAALDAGALDLGRWSSFQKLQREQAYAARKSDPRLERETKAAWKKVKIPGASPGAFDKTAANSSDHNAIRA